MNPATHSNRTIWVLFPVMLAGIIAFAFWKRASPPVPSDSAAVLNRESPPASSRSASVLPQLFTAPDFAFTERSGRTLATSDLLGHVWIVDFIFTYCAGPCPIMTGHMVDLQSRFADAPELRFVSITVDPQRDTPDVLADYANRYGADPRRWFFLTGDPTTVRRIALEGFLVVARETTDQERREQDMNEILHSTYFMLVDATGHVRGIYEATDAERLAQLVTDTRQLLASGGK